MTKAELTYLDKRVFCDLRNGMTLHLGLVSATSIGARTPPEFVNFECPFGVINASLVKVTTKSVLYRQVMSEGGQQFHVAQK